MKRLFAILLSALLLLCGCEKENTSDGTVSEPEQSEESEWAPPELDNSMLVVFGDSITALGSWGRTVAEECNMRFFNGARGGITSAEGIARFDAFVAARDADFVTLCFGMNDLLMTAPDTPKVTPEQFKQNMITLVEKTRQIGAVPILLTTNTLNSDIFFTSQGQDSSWYTGRDIDQWLNTYNDMTRAVAKETECLLIDLHSECLKYTVDKVVCADGIHLNESGNKLFADTVSAALKESFLSDPNAEPVNYDNYVLLSSGEKGVLAPIQKEAWYIEGNTVRIIQGERISFQNTNGLWPEVQCCITPGIKVPVENGVLHVSISTANVNASIVLYMDGGYPHAYSEGQYIIINEYLQCDRDSYTGDILGNQQIDIEIPLSQIPFAQSVIQDGHVTFTGIKIYIAGTAYQRVTVEDISVSVK